MKFLVYIFLFLFVDNFYCQKCPCSIAWHDSTFVQRVKKMKKGVYCCNDVDSLPRFTNTRCELMFGESCFHEYVYKHLPTFNDSQVSSLPIKNTVVRIGFIVKKDGSIVDAKIVNPSLAPDWDVAHLSAIRKCPKFVSPAKRKNIAVDYYCETIFEHIRIY